MGRLLPPARGASALRRNRNPADCKEEKEYAEEACAGRDVDCPDGSTQRQVQEGRLGRGALSVFSTHYRFRRKKNSWVIL